MTRLLLLFTLLVLISSAGCIGKFPSSRGQICISDEDCWDLSCLQSICGGVRSEKAKEVIHEEHNASEKTERVVELDEPDFQERLVEKREEGVSESLEGKAEEKRIPDEPSKQPDEVSKERVIREQKEKQREETSEIFEKKTESIAEDLQDGGERVSESIAEGPLEQSPEYFKEPKIEKKVESLPDSGGFDGACFVGSKRPCYTGPVATRGIGNCSLGKETCLSSKTWGACVGERKPSKELCDGKDNDCNGQTDEKLGSLTCGRGDCIVSAPVCFKGKVQTCNPKAPVSQEICGDGHDNDCDGLFDEGCRFCLPSRLSGSFEKSSRGEISGLALSPDGKTLAIVSNRAIQLVDTRTKKQIRLLDEHKGVVSSLAFSPDGKMLASASRDKTIKLWDLKTGKSRTLARHTSWVSGLSFSLDGRTLASASRDKSVLLWLPLNGAYIGRLQHKTPVESVVLCGSKVITGSYDGSVRIWDEGTGRLQSTLKGHKGAVSSVVCHPKEQLFASAGFDGLVKIWNFSSTTPLHTFREHKSAVRSLAFSPDGKAIVSGGNDKSVFVHEVLSKQMRFELTGHYQKITALAISTIGAPLLASGSADSSVRLWKLETGRLSEIFAGHSDDVQSALFISSGKWMITASKSTILKVWDVAEKQPVTLLAGHRAGVNSLALSPDGKWFASASSDRTVRIWDAAKLKYHATLSGQRGAINSVAFSPNGKWIASGSSDRSVWIWELSKTAKGKTLTTPLYKLNGHKGVVYSLVFQYNSKVLVSGSQDKTIKLWDLQTLKPITLTAPKGAVLSVALSPTDKWLAVASQDMKVYVWRVAHLQAPPKILSGHSAAVKHLSFDFSGELLATASEDKTIRLWELAKNFRSTVLKGHSHPVLGLAFRPDNKQIASVSSGHRVLFWDCPCNPGTQQGCYLGPASTRDFGRCRSGFQKCSSLGIWLKCAGETLPRAETPDKVDNNCDGRIDEGFAELQVRSLTLSKTTVKIGERIKITVCSSNQGKGGTDGFRIRLYLAVANFDIPSRAQNLTGGTNLPSDIVYPSMSAGSAPNCQVRTIKISRILPGNRVIGALIDFENDIAETDESNNLKSLKVSITQ